MRRAAKVDDNQTAIVEALRQAGASVFVGSALGQGFPDLVVGAGFRTGLFEVKDGGKSPSRRKLTDDQVRFRKFWLGHYCVVETVGEAIHELELLKLG